MNASRHTARSSVLPTRDTARRSRVRRDRSTALLVRTWPCLCAWGLIQAVHVPPIPGSCPIGVVDAQGQDFVAPAPQGSAPSALVFLERGLPSSAGTQVQVATTRWFGLDALTTRSAGFAGGLGSFRGALGVSQTEDPELGWSALGIAAGAAGKAAGSALRAVLRRNRDPAGGPAELAPGLGLEAGGAAFVRVSERTELWASAPQLWNRGATPPLARPLEIGGRYRAEGLSAWLVHRAPVYSGMHGEREIGFAASARGAAMWIGARDHPLRGVVGGSARVGGAAVALALESHPVLGETVSLALALGRGE